MEVVDLPHLKLRVATLPADQVPEKYSADGQEAGKAAPIDGGITKKEVLDDFVVPAAHAEADVEDRPLPELRGEVVLLVRIGDERVVGGHHGDVEVEEVSEEGGFVGAWVPCGYYELLVLEFWKYQSRASRFSFQCDSTFQ